MRRLFVVLLISAILAACGVFAPARELASTGQEKPLATAPTGQGTEELAAREPDQKSSPTATHPAQSQQNAFPPKIACAPGSLDEAVLLQVWDERVSRPSNEIFPVNPKTGKSICGYAPIQYFANSQTFLSPDQHKLVIFDFANEYHTNGSLRLVNLIKWKEITGAITAKDWVTAAAYSPYEGRLAFSYADRKAGVIDGRQQFALVLADLSKMEIIAQKQLDFQPKLLGYTQAGSHLIVYGALTGPQDGLQPEARLIVLNNQNLTPVWEQPLPGILDGMVFPHNPGADPVGTVWGTAAVLYGSKLYIVPSDEDKLITIDFARRSLQAQEIRPAISLLDRLLALFGPSTAYAKGLNGTQKKAVLSKDGKTLFLLGWTDSMVKDESGNWQYEHISQGLKVIDLAHALELDSLDIDATDLAMSADSGFLLLTRWDRPQPVTEVVDAQRSKLLLSLEGAWLYSTRTLGGEYVTLAVYRGEEQTKVNLLDPATWKPAAAWSVDSPDVSVIDTITE